MSALGARLAELREEQTRLKAEGFDLHQRIAAEVERHRLADGQLAQEAAALAGKLRDLATRIAEAQENEKRTTGPQ